MSKTCATKAVWGQSLTAQLGRQHPAAIRVDGLCDGVDETAFPGLQPYPEHDPWAGVPTAGLGLAADVDNVVGWKQSAVGAGPDSAFPAPLWA